MATAARQAGSTEGSNGAAEGQPAALQAASSEKVQVVLVGATVTEAEVEEAVARRWVANPVLVRAGSPGSTAEQDGKKQQPACRPRRLRNKVKTARPGRACGKFWHWVRHAAIVPFALRARAFTVPFTAGFFPDLDPVDGDGRLQRDI